MDFSSTREPGKREVRWIPHVGHGYMSESEAFVGGMSCYANMVKCCSLWATRLAGA